MSAKKSNQQQHNFQTEAMLVQTHINSTLLP